MGELELLLIWVVVFILFYAVAMVAERVIGNAFRHCQYQPVVYIATNIVFYAIIALGVFHPVFVTYPTFFSTAGVVSENGDYRELPYGAIDSLVDGIVVRPEEKIVCRYHLGVVAHSPYGFNTDITAGDTFVAVYKLESIPAFYKKHKGEGERAFCAEVEGIVQWKAYAAISSAGVVIDNHPETPWANFMDKRKELLESIKVDLVKHAYGTGVYLNDLIWR